MVIQYVQDAFNKFVKYQASGGILLLIMALLAIIAANSNFHTTYHHILEMPVIFKIGYFEINHKFEHFVNDGLMVIFFLLVSLEIKREIIEGHLSSRDQQIIPVVGALGGVIFPALIFVALNWNNSAAGPDVLKGWAIPTATDIAFAIGILSLFGKRVPVSLKVFLTALAIIDDLAAIIIIAIFYNTDLSVAHLLFGVIITISLVVMNLMGVVKKTPYFALGFILWLTVLESGVHATLAGVVLGLTIPLRAKDANGESPLKRAEHALEPWVAFGILPIFAFCNAGVSLKGMHLSEVFTNQLSLGILAGLFIGKQFGVFGTLLILIKTGMAKMPKQTTWAQIYGVSILTGIGFTMSIFIGNLAYIGNEGIINTARIGIICGSFLAAISGYVILHFTCPKYAPQKRSRKKTAA